MAQKSKESAAGSTTTSSVDAFLAALDHPYKNGIQALRETILSLDTGILEEVKWNAPSFRFEDHFATFRLHPAPMFQLILHTGAKTKTSPKQFQLHDPAGLAKWATGDRCSLIFQSDEDALSKRDAVAEIVREWIAQL